ncbi:MAG: response regulator [Prolixibacteraceae bacterium]|nr:response regulator [Prolixibacteraceae bacterium]
MKKQFKILLVEDNPLNQKIVSFNLRKENHEVTIAENGLVAIEVFKKERFDFVLMDIMMPEMDGLDASVNIRKLEKENNLSRTPIIALTANTLDNDRDKCLSFGMDEYMAKPFRMAKLQDLLDILEIS